MRPLILICFISKLAKMENPYKEPKKGCLLCNVTVDYKNIQVSSVVPVPVVPQEYQVYGSI